MSQPPHRVSGLIKLGRWSMLGLGIFYGAFNQKRLAKKEAIAREEEAKIKKIRDEKIAKDKKRLAEAEKRAIDILSGKLD